MAKKKITKKAIKKLITSIKKKPKKVAIESQPAKAANRR